MPKQGKLTRKEKQQLKQMDKDDRQISMMAAQDAKNDEIARRQLASGKYKNVGGKLVRIPRKERGK